MGGILRCLLGIRWQAKFHGCTFANAVLNAPFYQYTRKLYDGVVIHAHIGKALADNLLQVVLAS